MSRIERKVPIKGVWITGKKQKIKNCENHGILDFSYNNNFIILYCGFTFSARPHLYNYFNT